MATSNWVAPASRLRWGSSMASIMPLPVKHMKLSRYGKRSVGLWILKKWIYLNIVNFKALAFAMCLRVMVGFSGSSSKSWPWWIPLVSSSTFSSSASSFLLWSIFSFNVFGLSTFGTSTYDVCLGRSNMHNEKNFDKESYQQGNSKYDAQCANNKEWESKSSHWVEQGTNWRACMRDSKTWGKVNWTFWHCLCTQHISQPKAHFSPCRDAWLPWWEQLHEDAQHRSSCSSICNSFQEPWGTKFWKIANKCTFH